MKNVDFKKVLELAESYKPDITKFLRDMIAIPSESCDEEKVVLRIKEEMLKVGFDTIDFGSFVSAKAIPQLKDTAEVLQKLDLSTTNSKLLSLVQSISVPSKARLPLTLKPATLIP